MAVGWPSALGSFLGTQMHIILAKLVYATVESTAFLWSRQGASIIAAAEGVLLLKTAGGARTVGVAAMTASAICAGRFCWALFHTMKAENTSEEQLKASSAAAAKAINDASQSIWDWQPPTGDPLASGAWSVLKELATTATTLQSTYPEVAELMTRPELQPTELAARLYYLYMSHEALCLTNMLGGEEGKGVDSQPANSTAGAVPSADMLELVRKYRIFACLAYDKTDDISLGNSLAEYDYRLITAQYSPEIVTSGCPAFYFAIKEESKEALLAVRGTYSPEDVFTDLLASGVAFETSGSSVHAGMAKAAGFLSLKYGALLRALYDTDYTITLTGHSLGAGVASLLALFLKERGLEPGKLRCVCYEPPACMDLPLAQLCAEGNLVTSVVIGDDIVPRMAAGPFIALLKELVVFDWRAEAGKEGQDLPAALAVMQKLANMFGTKGNQDPDAASKNNDSSAENVSLTVDGTEGDKDGLYNPFVPGTVLFVCMPSGGSTAAAVRKVVPPTSSVLRQIRITSRMVTDHFIDKADGIALIEGGASFI